MINKITIINGVRIIDNKYVIKKNNFKDNDIFKYLLSRSFNYFPKILKINDDEVYFEYIKDICEPNEQKIIDLVILLSILHDKTTFYKEVDIDYYKNIYESINDKISTVYNYYNQVIDNIDNEVYMSPADYLIARNISIIYKNIVYARNNISLWYKLISSKREVRLVTIHNNPSLEHYLKSDKAYLISWDRTKIDMPIYDLLQLYQNHYLDFDFIPLFDIYFKKYHLKKDEMLLFLTLLAIPPIIKSSDTEYNLVLAVRRIIDYLYKTEAILEKYGIEKQDNES